MKKANKAGQGNGKYAGFYINIIRIIWDNSQFKSILRTRVDGAVGNHVRKCK